MSELKKSIQKLCFSDEWGGSYSIYGNKEYYRITNYPNSEFPQLSIVLYDDFLGGGFCESTLYTDGDQRTTTTLSGYKKQLKEFERLIHLETYEFRN